MNEEDLNEKKAVDDERDEKRKKKKAKGKVKGKLTVTALVIKAILSMLKVLLIASMIGLIYEGTSYVLELIRAVDNPNETLATLGVDQLEELLEISGDDTNGYYYTYVDNFDEKVEELAERTLREHNLPGTTSELIEKMIRAQLVNEFPNLGTTIDNNNASEDETGEGAENELEIPEAIQGNIRIRRVTPNRSIGELRDVSGGVVSQTRNENVSSSATHKVVIDAGHGDSRYSGGYDELATSEEDLRNGKKYYTSGTSGTAADGTTWEEAETVQKVVDLAIRIMGERYPNIEAIQTGKDQPNFKRIDLAKEEGAEAYVGVHLNSGEGSGSEAYIRPGSGNGESEDFAQDIVDAVSDKLSLSNHGVNTNLESNTRGLKTYSECGIPNMYIEGAYMDNEHDMSIVGTEEGLEKYAEGIVEGIANYFGESATDGDNTSDSNTTVRTSSSINSQVYDLKYVPEDVFDNYVEENNQEAIRTFTLDEEGRLITAKWSFTSEGGISIFKNSPINFKNVMYKYVTTYEYMLDYWIDIKEEDFVNEFIDNVLNSEFIVMIEDDVTITQTVTTTTTVEADGTYTTEVPEVTISETVRDKIELTYADTWFVTVSKDFSFSTATLQSATNRGVMLRGSRGDLLGSFRVTGYCPCEECSNSYGTGTSTGATCTANRTIAVDPNVLPYGTKVIIEGLEPNIYVAEDCGGAVDRKSYRCLC